MIALNWVDWVIVLITAVSTLISLWRGFTREALSLLGWIGALAAAALLAPAVSAQMEHFIHNSTGRYMAAFMLLLVGVLVTAALITRFSVRLVKASGLGTLDRILGMGFGFARGVLVIIVLVFVVRNLVPQQSLPALRESWLLPHVDLMAHSLGQLLAQTGLLPEDLAAGSLNQS